MRRVWSKYGVFNVRFEPATARRACDTVVVEHEGALGLEVVDQHTIAHVLKLLIYDMQREVEHEGRSLI